MLLASRVWDGGTVGISTAVSVAIGRVALTSDEVGAADVVLKISSQLFLVIMINGINATGWRRRPGWCCSFWIRVRGLVFE